MIIKSAEFIKSSARSDQYPETGFPEICFAGKSNVGKSSLINTLLGRKKLVKISSTPGKTKLINFFLINEEFVFVDIPGFGYSKVSKDIKKSWGKMVEDYLQKRATLKCVILLMDIRRDAPTYEEKEFIEWLDYFKIKTIFVFTKSDKLSRNQSNRQVIKISKNLSLKKTDILLFSSKDATGREELWERICFIKKEN